jgi:hypothetical protein
MPAKSRVEPYGADLPSLNSHNFDVPQVLPALHRFKVPDPWERLFLEGAGIIAGLDSHTYMYSGLVGCYVVLATMHVLSPRSGCCMTIIHHDLTSMSKVILWKLFPPNGEVNALCVVSHEVAFLQLQQTGFN